MVKRLDRLGINCAHIQVEQIGPMIHQGEHFDAGLSRGILWGSIFHQKSAECHDLQRKQIKINFLKNKMPSQSQLTLHNDQYEFPSQ